MPAPGAVIEEASRAPAMAGAPDPYGPQDHDGKIMIRFLFRLAGLFVLAGAFVAFVYDGTKTIAGNNVYVTKLGDSWNAVHSTSLPLVKPTLERFSPLLWDPVMVNVLAAPTWAVLAVLGALLILIGRKKKRLIGYARD